VADRELIQGWSDPCPNSSTRSETMKTSWIVAALLCTALVAGCSDTTPENAQNFDQTAFAAPADATAQPLTESAPVVQGPSSAQDRSAAAAPRETVATRQASPRPAASRPAPAASAPQAASYAAPAAAPPAPAAPRFREVTAPANTSLALELMTALSSETAEVETPVRARLRESIVADGYTVLPAGAMLSGNVIDVARAGRVQGRSRLVFRFTEVEVEGGREELRTNPITFEGEATKGEDATKIGAGAVGGAIIGGILGGGSGAAKGAAIGGAAGTGVVLATRGREVTLAAGSQISTTLATPYFVQVPVR
jgi:hypothetical protein